MIAAKIRNPKVQRPAIRPITTLSSKKIFTDHLNWFFILGIWLFSLTKNIYIGTSIGLT